MQYLSWFAGIYHAEYFADHPDFESLAKGKVGVAELGHPGLTRWFLQDTHCDSGQ